MAHFWPKPVVNILKKALANFFLHIWMRDLAPSKLVGSQITPKIKNVSLG
jgi:hypothetical protein